MRGFGIQTSDYGMCSRTNQSAASRFLSLPVSLVSKAALTMLAGLGIACWSRKRGAPGLSSRGAWCEKLTPPSTNQLFLVIWGAWLSYLSRYPAEAKSCQTRPLTGEGCPLARCQGTVPFLRLFSPEPYRYDMSQPEQSDKRSQSPRCLACVISKVLLLRCLWFLILRRGELNGSSTPLAAATMLEGSPVPKMLRYVSKVRGETTLDSQGRIESVMISPVEAR